MDARRFLIPVFTAAALAGCAGTQDEAFEALTQTTTSPVVLAVTQPAVPALVHGLVPEARLDPVQMGRDAIVAANDQARQPSRADRFVGGVQVFPWEPGRIYEVWTAPLRVTTLTLSPGEAVLSKAAGDTVRWQIGETSSGEGAQQRVHIVLKPLERGIETNLILTTNRRVIMVELRSGTPTSFNAAVAWDAVEPPATAIHSTGAAALQMYAVEPQGRRPQWTPDVVFSDGQRTHVVLPAGTSTTPVLMELSADGRGQLVNYRQSGVVLSTDHVLQAGELRLGERRPQIVRLRLLAGTPK